MKPECSAIIEFFAFYLLSVHLLLSKKNYVDSL